MSVSFRVQPRDKYGRFLTNKPARDSRGRFTHVVKQVRDSRGRFLAPHWKSQKRDSMGRFL